MGQGAGQPPGHGLIIIQPKINKYTYIQSPLYLITIANFSQKCQIRKVEILVQRSHYYISRAHHNA